MKNIVNFGKNVAFTPARVAYPESAAELQGLVRQAKKLCVMGSGHSWSPAIVTDQALPSPSRTWARSPSSR